MKCNVFPAIIAVVIACLLAYLAYTIAEGKENDVVCGIVSFVCFASTLVSTLSLRTDSSRLNINLRVMSTVFFTVFIVVNFVFAATTLTMPYYVIINALLVTIFMAALYKFSTLKDV